MFRKTAKMLLAVVFVAGVGLMLWQILHYGMEQQLTQEAQLIAFEKADPPAEDYGVEHIRFDPMILPEPEPTAIPKDDGAIFMTEVNVMALRQINPDVLGWIYIPDTVISYPLMQTQTRDGYLHIAWDGTKSKSGSIFLEQKNSRDFSDFNTIIYGHHMGNGSMFGTLKYFRDQAYTQAHPNIYICTGDQIFRYEIFSVYDAPIQSDTYRLYFADTQAKQRALTHFISSNTLDLDLIPTEEDSILTLSTCTGTGVYTSRIVVQAVMTGQWKK